MIEIELVKEGMQAVLVEDLRVFEGFVKGALVNVHLPTGWDKYLNIYSKKENRSHAQQIIIKVSLGDKRGIFDRKACFLRRLELPSSVQLELF